MSTKPLFINTYGDRAGVMWVRSLDNPDNPAWGTMEGRRLVRKGWDRAFLLNGIWRSMMWWAWKEKP